VISRIGPRVRLRKGIKLEVATAAMIGPASVLTFDTFGQRTEGRAETRKAERGRLLPFIYRRASGPEF